MALTAQRLTPLDAVRLTQRELEVLRLIATGCESQEAADRLFVSPRTVNYHLANIYEKLGVNNRLRAIHTARRLGILPSEPLR